ncbi:hypothetical protein Nans01_14020 [Nocardiopsis ansamitocini]|uniref:Uncharacterized protein n=1 Tax=Nocardiopsis ansamitocini TaxID=1670832 RepID=A0A9W6P4L1_9ACTN|nr:hypothetical protein Nans01_14020 [Nocardiopsis ansamitocini]
MEKAVDVTRNNTDTQPAAQTPLSGGAAKIAAKETGRVSTPTSSQGRRCPHRDRVRSDRATAKGSPRTSQIVGARITSAASAAGTASTLVR